MDSDSDDPLPGEISLSRSQKEVVDAISSGKNLFFSGAAGSGKSYILNLIKDLAKSLKVSDRVAFTATTGVAACNIGGVTIHSWGGIGLGKERIDLLVAKARGRKDLKARWSTTELLIIDEISMLNADIFDLLSKMGSAMRNDPRPFGGIQIILTGDFFQLPPVEISNDGGYCFDSEVWKRIFVGSAGDWLDQPTLN